MPGTIQVSVLEFMDLPSSLPSSSISIKVSMGEREYQTWDKGDFSFPLTTLHGKLTVTLRDADGNEILHTGVETMSVVEKGLWDDFFPLERGGLVHMKLQFILSEEERNRIRIMRESALKKKSTELLNSSPRHPETGGTVGHTVASSLRHNYEVSDSRAGPVSNPVNFCEVTNSGIGIKEKTHLDQKQINPNDTDRRDETTSTASVLQEVKVQLTEVNSGDLVEKIQSQSPPADVSARAIYAEGATESIVEARSNSISSKVEEVPTCSPEKQGPLERTPSNVRKMKSAFESSLAQDMKSRIKPPTTKSQSSKIGMENPQLKEVEMENTQPQRSISGRVMNPIQDTGRLKESSETHIQSIGTNSSLKNIFKGVHKKVDTKQEKRSPEDLMRTSTVETATVSGQMLDDEHLSRHQPCKLFVDQQNSGGTSVVGESEREIHSKDPNVTNIQRTSNDIKSVANSEDEHHSFESSGTWNFPDESRRLCITTGGKQVMDLTGGCSVEAKTHQGRMSFSKPGHTEEHSQHGGTDIEANKGAKSSKKLRKSKFESSADVEPSRGPVGQVIKVAIMVGFGTLVLFTRQRKNR